MGLRGPKPKSECAHGHDLTLPGAVKIVKRGKYTERQCIKCTRARARRWWRDNRSVDGRDSAA